MNNATEAEASTPQPDAVGLVSAPRSLDHVVIAGPDLIAAVDELESITGVRAAPGGSHPIGTANYLIALTVDGQRVEQYIEIIGPDPERVDRRLPTKFGIDRLTRVSVVAYAIRPDDIDAAAVAMAATGADPGPVVPLSRRTPTGDLLEWRLTHSLVPEVSPLLPFLIDWGDTRHPGLTNIPTIELVALAGFAPNSDAIVQVLEALGETLTLTTDDVTRLALSVRGPRGEVTI